MCVCSRACVSVCVCVYSTLLYHCVRIEHCFGAKWVFTSGSNFTHNYCVERWQKVIGVIRLYSFFFRSSLQIQTANLVIPPFEQSICRLVIDAVVALMRILFVFISFTLYKWKKFELYTINVITRVPSLLFSFIYIFRRENNIIYYKILLYY